MVCFFCLFVFLNQFVILMMVTVSITSNSTKSGSKQGLEDQDLNSLYFALCKIHCHEKLKCMLNL